jgi:hypothetical protein
VSVSCTKALYVYGFAYSYMMLGGNQVVKTWLGNANNTIYCSIPMKISKRYGLDKPTYVVLEPLDQGILLRKLDGVESRSN